MEIKVDVLCGFIALVIVSLIWMFAWQTLGEVN